MFYWPAKVRSLKVLASQYVNIKSSREAAAKKDPVHDRLDAPYVTSEPIQGPPRQVQPFAIFDFGSRLDGRITEDGENNPALSSLEGSPGDTELGKDNVSMETEMFTVSGVGEMIPNNPQLVHPTEICEQSTPNPPPPPPLPPFTSNLDANRKRKRLDVSLAELSLEHIHEQTDMKIQSIVLEYSAKLRSSVRASHPTGEREPRPKARKWDL